ncbi:MAG: DUF2155 domain-containing protein [Pseudomonadota bacterium]
MKRLIAMLVAIALAPIAKAPGQTGFIEVYESPVPADRGMPPEVAPDPEADTDDEPSLPGGQIAPEVEAPTAEADTPQSPSVSVLRPGDDGPVRVVFGPDGRATGDEDDPNAQATSWQQERDRRFRRAPIGLDGDADADQSGPLEPIASPETDLRDSVQLRHLDKMTGQTQTVDVAVGGEVLAGRLRIVLEACRAPESGAQHGTMAYLRIWDTKAPDAPVFTGWMFAESPALSAMDHPRYDVWVLNCDAGVTTASGD